MGVWLAGLKEVSSAEGSQPARHSLELLQQNVDLLWQLDLEEEECQKREREKEKILCKFFHRICVHIFFPPFGNPSGNGEISAELILSS